jgi:hypothetical protein
VRKQLQNTIHGRQKPAGGKDMPGGPAAAAAAAAAAQKMMNSPTLDSSKFSFIPSNQSFVFFRSKRSIFSKSIILSHVYSTLTNKHSITTTAKQNSDVIINITFLSFTCSTFSLTFVLLVVVVLYAYYVWGTVGD